MGGWTKSFLDGSSIIVTSEDALQGKGSWSKSRLDGMSGASLSEGGRHIAITGPGEYWQSDDLEVDVGVSGPAKVMVRRLMKRIDPAERLLQVLRTEHSIMLRVIDVRFGVGTILTADTLSSIPQDKAGQWLVLEYSVEKDAFKYYYSPERI